MLTVIRHLKPQTGRFEQVEIDIEPRCDDGTLPEDATINRWYDALRSATQIAGRPIAYNPATPQMLAAQGFVDIQQKVIRLPLSYWPGSGGPRREIAFFYPLALTDEAGLEAYSLGPLTRAPVSWPVEDVMRYCEETRRDIRNRNYHVYHEIGVESLSSQHSSHRLSALRTWSLRNSSANKGDFSGLGGDTGRKLRLKLPQPISRALAFISSQLPPANFITLHYAYFIGVPLLASVIFWGSSTPARSVSYTDSLFLVVSAMTMTGLNTVNLSAINTFQQFILFLLLLLGSPIAVSIAVVFVRLKAFERRFYVIVKEEKRKQKERGSLRRRMTFRSNSASKRQTGLDTANGELRGRQSHTAAPTEAGPDAKDLEMGGRVSPVVEEGTHQTRVKPPMLSVDTNTKTRVTDSERIEDNVNLPSGIRRKVTFAQSPASPAKIAPLARILSMQGVGAIHDLPNHPIGIARPETLLSPIAEHREKRDRKDLINHFSIPGIVGIVGRNSTFSSLSIADRERLGGVEYRTLEVLIIVVPLYFVAWQFFCAIGMGAWVANNGRELTEVNGLNPWYARLVSFPVFLRAILWTIWSLLRFLPATFRVKEHIETLRFLLDHPRRCYTNLFPSRHTWWLLATLISLNGIDWIAFEILNIGNKAILSGLSPGTRALDGLFQALAVRSGGFYVVTVLNLRVGLLILYVIMMYISVYPVVITMRNSNVYEERSLGIYSDDPSDTPFSSSTTNGPSAAEIQTPTTRKAALISGLKRRMTVLPGVSASSKPAPLETRGYFVRQQLRGQLAHDLWWVVLAVLFIAITETSSFEHDPVTYSVFNIIFEVISAYGTVGLSVGLPTQAYSFAGGWHVLSKLILCAVMIRGRHRGLPVAIDRAVLLPGEHLAAAEEQDALIRMERSSTKTSGQEKV
ncbi:MAG: hypothetical protein Q9181_003836 [Wetmoreana brouardii]